MDKFKRVAITQKQRELLISEKERTQTGVMKLLRGTRLTRPKGLTISMIEGWMSGEVSTVNSAHLNWVIERYRDYQPKTKVKPESNRILITKDMRQHLKTEKARTGLGVVNIIRHLSSPLPDGLTKNIIQSWERGTAKSAKAKHWNTVLSAYAKLPDSKR